MLLISVNRCCEKAALPNLICIDCRRDWLRQPDLETNMIPKPLTTNELANVSLWTRSAQVKYMKDWCRANYEAGGSTMVECWSDDDLLKLFDVTNADGSIDFKPRTFEQAFKLLYNLAATYADGEADGRAHWQQSMIATTAHGER
jgi:hypothetical protein